MAMPVFTISSIRPVFAAIFTAIHLGWAGLQLKSRTRRMWLRAPLLVLLLGWFVMGLAGGLFSAFVRNYRPGVLSASLVEGGFAPWALGFLVLVAVGLYGSVRNVRFLAPPTHAAACRRHNYCLGCSDAFTSARTGLTSTPSRPKSPGFERIVSPS